MKRTKPLIVIIASVAVLAAWLATGGVPDRDAGNDSAVPAAGYVVHIDPATGQVVEASPSTVAVTIDPQWADRLSTSSHGLVEQPSPVPGGGTMVDLQGRFQNAFVAAVDDSGRVGATCLTDPASGAGEGGEEQ
jgi:hypothetical protein